MLSSCVYHAQYQQKDIVYFLNAAGDLIDLLGALAPDTLPDYDKMSHHERLRTVNLQGRCSALIKVRVTFLFAVFDCLKAPRFNYFL